MGKHGNTTFDHARDELFSQIHRCGVLKAAPEQQQEWLRDTVSYLQDLHPALAESEVEELRALGERFCQPPIPHGKAHTELTRETWEDGVQEGAEEGSEGEARDEPASSV